MEPYEKCLRDAEYYVNHPEEYSTLQTIVASLQKMKQGTSVEPAVPEADTPQPEESRQSPDLNECCAAYQEISTRLIARISNVIGQNHTANLVTFLKDVSFNTYLQKELMPRPKNRENERFNLHAFCQIINFYLDQAGLLNSSLDGSIRLSPTTLARILSGTSALLEPQYKGTSIFQGYEKLTEQTVIEYFTHSYGSPKFTEELKTIFRQQS